MNEGRKYTLEEILEDVKKEFNFAISKWDGFSSLHEAYAIVLEEVDELWEEVKRSQKNPEHIELAKEEAIQVATMAIRLIFDCCTKGSD